MKNGKIVRRFKEDCTQVDYDEDNIKDEEFKDFLFKIYDGKFIKGYLDSLYDDKVLKLLEDR